MRQPNINSAEVLPLTRTTVALTGKQTMARPLHPIRRRRTAAIAALLTCVLAVAASAPAQTTTKLEVRAFPLKGRTNNLQPQKLDFRYAPYRWQTCIGLPDDPHKSIIGSDGGLYYDYGRGRFYDFQTRILAQLDANEPTGKIRQSLLDPRIPIVITQQDFGPLTLTQQAWANAPSSPDLETWSRQRTDYLSLQMYNRGLKTTPGRLVIQVNSKTPLILNDDRTELFYKQNPWRKFCTISPRCTAVRYAQGPDTKIVIDRPPGISRNWARPNVPSHPAFHHIAVGWNRPLIFTYPAEPNEQYRIAFGLIEGHHTKPGIRPLEIRIEQQIAHPVDLVRDLGRNTPVVLSFDAQDENGDGLIEMGVYPLAGAKDTNTIISALWIFNADDAPSNSDILAGKADTQALAFTSVDKLALQTNSLKLLFERPLAPYQNFRALLAFHRGDNAKPQANRRRAPDPRVRAIKYWNDVDLPYDRILVPDPTVQGLIDSCIRNIFQAREIKDGRPAFQVGPTCYRGTWAADGPFILEAVTYLGRAAEARAGLEQQVDQDQGPAGVEFSKKSGLRLWMIWRHAQLTGDWEWLEEMWPRIEREVKQIIEYRRMTRSDPNQANFGLMPIGFGDGGLGGKHREYTNVYWTLAGLKAAIQAARQLGKSEPADWQAEYDDYWQTFDRARNRDKLTDHAGNGYVPVTMKGEAPQLPQRGAWAFLHSIFPGRIFDPNDSLMLGTMAMLDATEKEGLIYGTGWLEDGIWNYAASFYAHAHLRLGHGRKAAATLYAFANHASPLLCWREEQNLVGKKERYCGDMPHNWAGAEFIRLVRHLLILERSDELHLLEGLPSSWTKPSDTTKLTDIPTSFGPVGIELRIATEGHTATLTIDPPTREPSEKIVVHLEHFSRPIKHISIAGSPLSQPDVTIPTDQPVTLKIDFGS